MGRTAGIKISQCEAAVWPWREIYEQEKKNFLPISVLN